MSSFKFKRGQESKVSSLAREDGSLIFSLDGANDSTLRMDAAISGTVQRVGIAVDKAKNADVATKVVDYGNTKNTISIGYAGTELTASNLTHIAGYTDSGAKIKNVSKDVLKSWLGVEASSGYLKRYRDVNKYGSGYADLNGTLPPFIFAYKNGYPLHDDPDFASGMNGIKVYDNSNSGNVTIERIAMQNGNSSGYVLKISNKGAASPSLGGWYFGDGTAYARQYTCIFRAKIPTGRNVQWGSNSIGTNGNSFWLTEQAGTGKWEWYAYHIDCGSASFSSTNYFFIDGAVGTSSAPVVWYLSSANTYINSYGNYDGLRTRYADNATSAVSATNASTASYAAIAAYPQGFDSRSTSASWGNTTGTFITGWHTSSGGDVAFMNDNPSSGKVSMKLDGYFYQNEGAKRVLDTDDGATFVKKAGDTMTGQLVLTTGQDKGLKLGAAKVVAASASNGEFVLQGGHLRLGADAYDYNQWAGLKYDHSKKAVYLGIADGSIFQANSAQSNGSIFTPGISNIYLGASTAAKLLTSIDGAEYVKKSGDTMTGGISYKGSKATYSMIRFLDNATDTYGNGISIGGGGAAIIGGGESATTVQSLLTNGGDEKLILANDGAIDIYTNVQNGLSSATHVTIDTSGVYTGLASSAKVISPFESATANAARNVWFSDSTTRNKPCYNDNFKYNPITKVLTANIEGDNGKFTTINGPSEQVYQLNSDKLHATIDLTDSAYSTATWYPVVGGSIPSRGYTRIVCYVQLNSGTKPAWSTHNSGFTCNLDVLAKASGWGTTNAGSIILDYSYGFCGSSSPISYSQMTNSSLPVIWMRGGGKYFIRSSEKFDWSIKTAAYTINQQTVQPQNSCPGLSLVRSTIYASLDGTATNSNALGGSSLSQILASAGNGQAFTGLDTTTNNVVKLTRANGGTVQKTINNVSNASTAAYSQNSAKLSGYSIASTNKYFGAIPVIGSNGVMEVGKYLDFHGTSDSTSDYDIRINGSAGQLTLTASSPTTVTAGYFDGKAASASSATNASTANYAKNSDQLDGYHESKFLRYRDNVSASGSTSLWEQIGIREYHNCYPDEMSDGIYGYGEVISLPGPSMRLDLWANHYSSNSGSDTNGLQYRSGWNNDKKSWRMILDSINYKNYAADKTAITNASATSAKITFTRANAGTFAIDINNVANASTASYASNADKLGSLPSTDYALKKDLSGSTNVETAKRLPSFASASVKDSFFYRHGKPGVNDTADWTGFPSSVLSSSATAGNNFGNGMYQKDAGVLHLAAGSSYHDLVFQAGGTNDGIVYAGTGRNIAYLLDTQNYKSRGNDFNSLTAVSLAVSSTNVVIDGGGY